MTTRLLPPLAIALLAFIQLHGQPGSAATASASADIVEAVGTGSTGNTISCVFYQPSVVGKNMIQTGGIRSGNNFWAPLFQQENSASFQITGSQYGYSISTSFESIIPHHAVPGAFLTIRSLQLRPDTRAGNDTVPGDRYLLEAILEPEPGQAVGLYQSLQAGRVTIHFN